jgi:hypothetical protein
MLTIGAVSMPKRSGDSMSHQPKPISTFRLMGWAITIGLTCAALIALI